MCSCFPIKFRLFRYILFLFLESMLTSLTADFDEKMKLLLDPNYSGGSQSDTSSVQSTPSKKYTHPNLRRISEQPQRPPTKPLQPPPGQKNNRSLSLGEDSPGNQIPTPPTIQQQSPLATISGGGGSEQARSNKKSELKIRIKSDHTGRIARQSSVKNTSIYIIISRLFTKKMLIYQQRPRTLMILICHQRFRTL